MADRQKVSIHVPLAEHDFDAAHVPVRIKSFNSRAPRGARHWLERQNKVRKGFNSRAPRGARPDSPPPISASQSFQFTCPSRSTTTAAEKCREPSPRFNSRAPRGARPPRCRASCGSAGFNSRAPRGARPDYHDPKVRSNWVSIHVPLAEHDPRP